MLRSVQLHLNQACRRSFALQRINTRSVSGSLYEPDYINIKPEIPLYDTLYIRLRGYDFAILESYMKFVHKTANRLKLDATAFPVPARTTHIVSYGAQSTAQHNYHLALYERVVQVDELNALVTPIFIQVLQANMPAGVQMSIKPINEEEEDFRYVPDLTLLELQSQVAELDKAKDDRKKK